MTTTLREIALKQILEASEIELLVPVSHTAAPEPQTMKPCNLHLSNNC